MQFVKTHWISLVSGVVALAAIALAVIGITRASVIDEMQKRMQLANEISSLAKNPQNSDTIEAEVERGKKFEQEYENVVRTAESINERQPLMEGVFPEAAQIEIPYRFREAYQRRMWELPHVLKAGSLPNEDEIRDEVEIMADLEKRRREQEGDNPEVAEATAPQPGEPVGGGRVPGAGVPPVVGGGRTPGGRVPGARGGAAPPVAPPAAPLGPRAVPPGMNPMAAAGRARGGGRTPGITARQAPSPGGARTAVAMPTGNQAQEAQYRAEVKKARSIRIYAATDTSFQVSPMAYSANAPTPAEMWYAQVGLWVQEDLVNAIAQLNEEAAQKLAAQDVNVANLPVKRIESIRVHGYIDSKGSLVPFPGGDSTSGSRSAAAPPMSASFTGRRADDQFDVVRLTLTAVVDERDLLELVDAITRANFYQLVDIEYKTLDPAATAGYFYGDAPVVEAVLDFEGYMARKIYKAMMPEEVLKALGISGKEPAKPQAAGGRAGPSREAPKRK
jgi:hypothetical protein